MHNISNINKGSVFCINYVPQLSTQFQLISLFYSVHYKFIQSKAQVQRCINGPLT